MIRLTSKRVRSIIEHAETERELVSLLRSHKIKFTMEEAEELSVRIPARKGIIKALRNRSRFEIHNVSPVPFRPDNIDPLPLVSCTAWTDRLEVL